MNAARAFEPHLVVNEVTLPRGGEWTPRSRGWAFVQVRSGICYWQAPAGPSELAPGSVLVTTGEVGGNFRASQLSEVLIAHFSLDADKLPGLLSLGEQLTLAAAHKQYSTRLLPPEDPLAQRFQALCQNRNPGGLSSRLQLLQLFTDHFERALPGTTAPPPAETDGRARLRQFLNQMVAAEFLELSLTELAPRVHCSPRHLSRLFQQEVGMSFSEKQTQLRLARACQLLTTTNAKVIDVGSASGYPSNSLFTFMFKKHFGLSPGRWRERHGNQQPPRPERRAPRWSAGLPALHGGSATKER